MTIERRHTEIISLSHDATNKLRARDIWNQIVIREHRNLSDKCRTRLADTSIRERVLSGCHLTWLISSTDTRMVCTTFWGTMSFHGTMSVSSGRRTQEVSVTSSDPGHEHHCWHKWHDLLYGNTNGVYDFFPSGRRTQEVSVTPSDPGHEHHGWHNLA